MRDDQMKLSLLSVYDINV